MKIQYMSDLHMEFQENSRYLKNNELPVTRWDMFLRTNISPMVLIRASALSCKRHELVSNTLKPQYII